MHNELAASRYELASFDQATTCFPGQPRPTFAESHEFSFVGYARRG